MATPSRIHPLPIHLANQIAAGEVIERPASVVKELVENSIDAGAKHINVEIDGAGSKLIKVKDDGSGIHKDDIILALSRHATSKLNTSEQLSHISSLGFRGEALPSISSVAQLTVTTRQADSEYGWQLPAQQTETVPASHPIGTSIEVRDLFFNLPARRRFLRSEKTEVHHILTTIQRLALSQFEVGFQCAFNGSNKLSLPPATLPHEQQQRIAKICGKPFIENAVYFEQEYEQIKLTGWIGSAQAHRPQTDIQHFFINHRVIKDRVINHAIRQAYGDAIPNGRYPAFVLYLTLPLDKVDVNVHPTKHEVRFREARLIHGLITSAIADALQEKTEVDVKQPSEQQSSLELNEKPSPEYKHTQQKNVVKKEPRYTHSFSQNSQLLHQRYCVIDIDSLPHLVDLQLAEQQLNQKLFTESHQAGKLITRPILVPIKLPVTSAQIELIQSQQETLQNLGFKFSFNSNSAEIKQIPSLLAQVELRETLQNLILILEKTPSSNALVEAVPNLIPLCPINDLAHAKRLLEQLGEEINHPRWCCQLDLERLTSLFSC
jgi:DNA mismatch repair protein MutL